MGYRLMSSNRMKKYMKFFWIILLLILWETAARFSGVSPILMPTLFTIFEAFFRGLSSGLLLISTANSLLLIAAGLLTGSIIALLLSVISYFSEIISTMTDTLTSIFHPIPGIALLPLVILWFGIGELSITVIIIHSVVWPMVITLRTGFKEIPEHYLDVGRNYELNAAGLLFHILLPASLPYGVSGLKIAWARSWRAVISAEMVFGAMGGMGGLGWYLYSKRVFMDAPGMFAGIIMLIIIGMVFENALFSTLESRTLRKWGKS